MNRIRELYHSAELKPPQVAEPQKIYNPPKDIFLDLNQEWLVKIDLDLSEEGRAVLDTSHRLITGSAGSGKSVILLHRARLLAEMNSKHRILAVTHNRPLNEYLASRFGNLSKTATIEWTTFYSWVARNSKTAGDVIAYEQKRLVNQLLSQSSLKGKLTDKFIQEEFDWITNNDIKDRNEYLDTARTGRKRPLQPSMRDEVYKLYSSYRSLLDQQGKTDWPGFALKFLNELRSGAVRLQPYDAIFIDEAQFFVPVWFNCIRYALKEEGQLFMAADPTQGFLGSGQSWQQVSGLNIRGKSHTLSRPYRNTQEIISFAARFYKSRIAEEDETVNLPSQDQIKQLGKGPIPQLFQFSAPQDQISWVVGQVINKVQKKESTPDQILILHSDNAQVDMCVNMINKQKPGLAINAKQKGHSGKIRVCTINATTGLEAPIVFLLGLDKILEEEDALQTAPEDRPELVHRNTRKIYMAMTRAMSYLAMCFQHKQVRQVLTGS
ncbi:MAG: UvrD-helicase domain-containing protein [Verrucomicrobiota bacterium]